MPTPKKASVIVNQIRAGAILNYILIFLSIVTGLLYTPYMLRCLGQAEYGIYSLVASVISYLTLLDFGFGSAIVRFTARVRATGSKTDEWRLYGMFLSAYAILGFIITIGGAILYFNVDTMFDRTMTADELYQARIMLGLMVANLAITFPFSVFGSIISAYERFVFQRTINICRVILSTAVLVAVLALGYKAIALVIVQTVFSLGTLLINVFYCRYKLHIHLMFNNFNTKLLHEIMVFSFWNFLGAIVDRIYWGTGQFVLGIYSGPVAVAIFSVALSIMTLYMSMSTAFNGILLPRLTKMATDPSNDAAISELFIRTGRLQFCVLSLILSGFIIFGHRFITLWAGENYSASFYIALIFLVALLCPLIQNVGITILLARGQQKFRSLTYLAIALVSLIAQVIVTRRFGAIGCAWVIAATLIAGQWIVMNIYYAKIQHINILSFWQQIGRMSICPTLLTACGLVVANMFSISTWYTLAIAIAVYTLLYVPTFYALGMNHYEREIIKIPLTRVAR